MDTAKALGQVTIGKRQMNAAEDDEFLQSLLEPYAEDGPNGIKLIAKDKAYVCASKAIEKWRDLKDQDNIDYLKENF